MLVYVVSALCVSQAKKEIISCFLFTEITSKVRQNQRDIEWKLPEKTEKKTFIYYVVSSKLYL